MDVLLCAVWENLLEVLTCWRPVVSEDVCVSAWLGWASCLVLVLTTTCCGSGGSRLQLQGRLVIIDEVRCVMKYKCDETSPSHQKTSYSKSYTSTTYSIT